MTNQYLNIRIWLPLIVLYTRLAISWCLDNNNLPQLALIKTIELSRLCLLLNGSNLHQTLS